MQRPLLIVALLTAIESSAGQWPDVATARNAPGQSAIPQMQTLSRSEFDNAYRSLAADTGLVSRYSFKSMGYVIGMPGGLNTNAISAQLADVGETGQRLRLVVLLQRTNSQWAIKHRYRIYDNVTLLGAVSDEDAERVLAQVRGARTYSQGHRVTAIYARDSDHFPGDAPARTDFAVVLTANEDQSYLPNRRYVFVYRKGQAIQIVGKSDVHVVY